MGITLRYPKPARPDRPVLDGMPNFHYVTRDSRPGARMAILESGINAMAPVRAVDGWRRPAILIRSSPARAGTERTPWEDVIDLDAGVMTYFGDHKPNTASAFGSTKGNRALELAFRSYSGGLPSRHQAPPLLVFVTTPWFDQRNQIQDKGAVRFLGPAVLEDMIRIRAVDARTGRNYPNYRTQLRLLDLGNGGTVDWNWVNARKDPAASLESTLALAPEAWISWACGDGPSHVCP